MMASHTIPVFVIARLQSFGKTRIGMLMPESRESEIG
jgi:hypothetical protein